MLAELLRQDKQCPWWKASSQAVLTKLDQLLQTPLTVASAELTHSKTGITALAEGMAATVPIYEVHSRLIVVEQGLSQTNSNVEPDKRGSDIWNDGRSAHDSNWHHIIEDSERVACVLWRRQGTSQRMVQTDGGDHATTETRD